MHVLVLQWWFDTGARHLRSNGGFAIRTRTERGGRGREVRARGGRNRKRERTFVCERGGEKNYKDEEIDRKRRREREEEETKI